MIRFDDVSTDAFTSLSLNVDAGQVCRLTVSSHDTQRALMALLGGHAPPARGTLWFRDESVYACSEPKRIALYRRVGIVPEQGGLISNLKVWENILLPAEYHQRIEAAAAEPRVVSWWRALNGQTDTLRDLMARLPDRLSVLERRFAALARALLPEPDILVYDFLTVGLETDVAGRLRDLTRDVHRAKPDRVSVYLCPDDAASEKIHADVIRRVG